MSVLEQNRKFVIVTLRRDSYIKISTPLDITADSAGYKQKGDISGTQITSPHVTEGAELFTIG